MTRTRTCDTRTHTHAHAHTQSYVTRPAKINQVSAKNHRFFHFYSIITSITILYNHNKIFITTAEFNGLSSAAYGIGILRFERKILAKI